MRGEGDDHHGGGGAGDEEEDELPPQVAELAQASVPNSIKGIRACKRCGILKTIEQFINEGCENCQFLEMVCGSKLLLVLLGLFIIASSLIRFSG